MYHFNNQPMKHYDIFLFNNNHEVINSKQVFSTEQGAYYSAMMFQEQNKGDASFFQVKKVEK